MVRQIDIFLRANNAFKTMNLKCNLLINLSGISGDTDGKLELPLFSSLEQTALIILFAKKQKKKVETLCKFTLAFGYTSD